MKYDKKNYQKEYTYLITTINENFSRNLKGLAFCTDIYIKKVVFNIFFCRRARREGLGGRAGRKALAAQPTFTELTGSEALDQPLQDMISYIIRSLKMLLMLMMKTKMVMEMMIGSCF